MATQAINLRTGSTAPVFDRATRERLEFVSFIGNNGWSGPDLRRAVSSLRDEGWIEPNPVGGYMLAEAHSAESVERLRTHSRGRSDTRVLGWLLVRLRSLPHPVVGRRPAPPTRPIGLSFQSSWKPLFGFSRIQRRASWTTSLASARDPSGRYPLCSLLSPSRLLVRHISDTRRPTADPWPAFPQVIPVGAGPCQAVLGSGGPVRRAWAGMAGRGSGVKVRAELDRVAAWP
jgi:hypothetical protein